MTKTLRFSGQKKDVKADCFLGNRSKNTSWRGSMGYEKLYIVLLSHFNKGTRQLEHYRGLSQPH